MKSHIRVEQALVWLHLPAFHISNAVCVQIQAPSWASGTPLSQGVWPLPCPKHIAPILSFPLYLLALVSILQWPLFKVLLTTLARLLVKVLCQVDLVSTQELSSNRAGHKHQSPVATPGAQLGTDPQYVSAPTQVFPLTAGTRVSSSQAPLLFTLCLRAIGHSACSSAQ